MKVIRLKFYTTGKKWANQTARIFLSARPRPRSRYCSCSVLLIAMATFLRREQTKLVEAEKRLEQQQAANERGLASMAALRQEEALAEKLSASGSDPAKIDEYWRDLVERKAAMSQLAKEGSSLKELREKAGRDGVASEGRDRCPTKHCGMPISLPPSSVSCPDAERIALTPQSASDLTARATKANGDGGGNHWPPIISLSEEKGYFVRTGSAELLPAFREALTTTTMDKILKHHQAVRCRRNRNRRSYGRTGLRSESGLACCRRHNDAGGAGPARHRSSTVES
jgi:hypothetical protein